MAQIVYYIWHIFTIFYEDPARASTLVQKSYCYTVGVGVHIHLQNVRANVKNLGISVFLYFLLLLKFTYHTDKAPYNKSLRQARIRWLWHLWVLGHRSQRLQWPIVIMRCPASVVCCPSVCRPSSVRQLTFSTSSPEPLDGFWWNLVWMKYSRSLTSVVVFRPDPPRGRSRVGPN